jgi:uncharacterized membrane protein
MALGIIFAFAQAFAWSCTSLVLRNLSTRLDPFVVNGVRAVFGLIVLVPILLLTANLQEFALLTPNSLVYLIGSVVLGGVFGDALYVMSLKSLGVGVAFPISNSFPLFTVIFSALLLGTTIEWPTIVGMVLIMAGGLFCSAATGIGGARCLCHPKTPVDPGRTDRVGGGCPVGAEHGGDVYGDRGRERGHCQRRPHARRDSDFLCGGGVARANGERAAY